MVFHLIESRLASEQEWKLSIRGINEIHASQSTVLYMIREMGKTFRSLAYTHVSIWRRWRTTAGEFEGIFIITIRF